jgi:hypothetical protein
VLGVPFLTLRTCRVAVLKSTCSVLREFENLYPLVHVRLFGGLVPSHLPQAPVLLLAPLSRHLVEERAVHSPVEFVEVHRVDALAEPLMLGLQPPDCFLVFAPFISVAGLERGPHPFQNVVVEPQSAKQFSKLLFQCLLAHMATAAAGRVTLAFIGVAGAV